MNVLLIEDDQDISLLLEKHLMVMGYRPDCFENAEDALGVLDNRQYSMAILDWMLPGMDGLSLARYLRSQPGGDLMYIMMVTAHDAPEELRRALQAGVNDYLTKPIDFHSFNIRVLIAEQRLHKLRQQGDLGNELKIRSEERALEGDLRHLLEERDERIGKIQRQLEKEIARRSEAEQTLAQNEKVYRNMISGMPGSAMMFDRELVYRIVEGRKSGSEFISGDKKARKTEFVFEGKSVRDSHPPDVSEELIPYYRAALYGATNEFEWEQNGSIYQLQTMPVKNDRGEIFAGLVISQDVTERRLRERKLRDERERLELAERGADDGLWDWDLRGQKLYTSERWNAIASVPEPGPRTQGAWFELIDKRDRGRVQTEFSAHLNGATPRFESEHRILLGSGEVIWVYCRGQAVRDPYGRAYRIAGLMSDITRRKIVEENMMRNTMYDPLTGLPNRVLLGERLRMKAERGADLEGYQFAAVYIDIIRFRTITEHFGYAVGDKLLKRAADRLNACVREEDTLARVGGDKFVILINNIGPGEEYEALQKIKDKFQTPFVLDDNQEEIFLTLSIGVAFYEPDYVEVEDLLRDAEIAMSRAKINNSGDYEVFRDFMQIHAKIKIQLEMELRRALQELDFQLSYQPILASDSREMVGVETLIRWNHPKFGPISPEQFIPIAEETGMIISIGEWILKTACLQTKLWQSLGYPPFYVSVNISPRQFQDPKFIHIIEDTLEKTRLQPKYLVLEITESSAMTNVNYTREMLEGFLELGIRISIDDFGTGYSSLAYLKTFPIHYLKMDRSFVKDLPENPDSAAIAEAILSMARGLKVDVVAEGIETEAQLEFVKERFCRYVQGFLFARPLSARDLSMFMEKNKPA